MCSNSVKCLNVTKKTDGHVYIDSFRLNDKFIELCFADEHNASTVQQSFPDHPGEHGCVALDQSTTGLKHTFLVLQSDKSYYLTKLYFIYWISLSIMLEGFDTQIK